MRDERSTPSSPPPPPAPLPSSAFTPPPPRPRRSAWFWIAIIGGCCALLIPIALIVAAVAIPQVLKFRKNANEASAVLVLHAVGQAEANYNVTYPANGYACSLATLGGDPGSGAPSAQAAQLIDPTLAATGRKSGYTFTIVCGAKVTLNNQDSYTSYQLTAVPDQVGKSGDKGYCSDQDGVVRSDPDGGTNCTQPLP
jgi:type IV pilus assembly protein PilA